MNKTVVLYIMNTIIKSIVTINKKIHYLSISRIMEPSEITDGLHAFKTDAKLLLYSLILVKTSSHLSLTYSRVNFILAVF